MTLEIITERIPNSPAYRTRSSVAGPVMSGRVSGASRPITPQVELAELLHIAPSLVVAYADHLESLGAITRERDPANRHRQQLRLTPAGRQLLGLAHAVATAVDDEILAGLSVADAAVVRTFLASLAERSASIPNA